MNRVGVSNHTVKMLDASTLNPAPYNPRKIGAAKLDALKTSLKAHGWVENLVIQKNGLVVIGGHQRLKAYVEICKESDVKMGKVPCVVLDVSERVAKKLNVALNRVTGEFDSKKLGELLIELQEDTRLLDDEIRSMGFTVDEVSRFVDVARPPDTNVTDDPTTFAKSVTLSIEFDSVEVRDRAKRLLVERAKAENKKTGSLLLELLR